MKTLSLGAVPLTVEQKRRQDAICAESNPYKIHYAWAAESDMPVLKWSHDFEVHLERGASLREKYKKANISLFPWDILARLKPDQKKNSIYAWNQGSRPSCSCHGAAHAFQASQLIQIALGAPLIYDACNPIYNFYRGRGGNYAGGLDILTTAEEINQTGMFPVSSVGTDNISVSSEGLKKTQEAKKHQAGIIRVEDDLVENIFRVCRGLGAIAFASSIYFTSSQTDSNGVRVMRGISHGGHMQCFHSWKKVGSKDYIFCQNSHGDIYGSSGNEPASGAWVDRDIVKRYYDYGMEDYGYPLVVFSEGELEEGAL